MDFVQNQMRNVCQLLRTMHQYLQHVSGRGEGDFFFASARTNFSDCISHVHLTATVPKLSLVEVRF